MSAEDYHKCIQRQGVDATICGRTNLLGEWCFVDVEHAIRNHNNQGRLLVCKKCLEVLSEKVAEMKELSHYP